MKCRVYPEPWTDPLCTPPCPLAPGTSSARAHALQLPSRRGRLGGVLRENREAQGPVPEARKGWRVARRPECQQREGGRRWEV